MDAAGIEAVPAAALRALAVALEVELAVVVVSDVVLAGDEKTSLPAALITWSAVSNCSGFDKCVMSPVCMRNAGSTGIALILAIASPSVPWGRGLPPA